MKRALSRGLCGTDLEPRTTKTLGMIYTAGLIAQKLKIIPAEWGSMDDALRAVVVTGGDRVVPEPSPLDRIKAFVQANVGAIIDVSDDRLPVTGEVFDKMPGIWLKENQRLVIPTKFFREGLKDANDILEGIDTLGLLEHDEGKFSKKAPRAITSGRRAYFINLSGAG